jgi:hypothetical protein
MLLKLSGQGAVYMRSNVKLASGSDSDYSVEANSCSKARTSNLRNSI